MRTMLSIYRERRRCRLLQLRWLQSIRTHVDLTNMLCPERIDRWPGQSECSLPRGADLQRPKIHFACGNTYNIDKPQTSKRHNKNQNLQLEFFLFLDKTMKKQWFRDLNFLRWTFLQVCKRVLPITFEFAHVLQRNTLQFELLSMNHHSFLLYASCNF